MPEGLPIAHDSARLHVTGEAIYTDDMPELPGTLHTALVLSDRPHARIAAIDTEAARCAPGVRLVLSGADLGEHAMIGPVFHDDPLLAVDKVVFAGQAVVAIAADTLRQARAACSLVRVSYEDLPAILTVDDAIAAGAFVGRNTVMARGDSAAALANAPRRLTGRIEIGGQEHFYLEGQIAYAAPRERGEMDVWVSTQNPTEVQHLVAHVLGLPDAAVTVDVRRIGGGFGGKESQPAQLACLVALIARATRRPAKLRLDRDDDMRMTGKRHDVRIRYDVGYDGDGRLLAAEFDVDARCGHSADLSNAVVDRTMSHLDNAYFLPDATIRSYRCRTNTVSATAFRGFGGPQGILAIEHVIDEIARELGRDPLDVRLLNLYGPDGRNVTPYHQTIETDVLPGLIGRLVQSSEYRARRREVDAFNRTHSRRKRGLALTPVKFGISFTAHHLNQGGALVHIYSDGSVHLNHGGVEMGQGLFTKVAQIVADVLGVPLDAVRITSTNTGKVPNSSPTAASAGADLNGAAAHAAATTLRERLTDFAAEKFSVPREEIRFEYGTVRYPDGEIAFSVLARQAYLARVSLSATGFYRTPEIYWDTVTMRGNPYYYFTYGAAVTEAEIDVITGEYSFPRADLLQDCGHSINPAIDRGQVEGGYIQGLGWLTTEELWWDPRGVLRTHAPSTYKIPTARDLPADFRVTLETAPNRKATVLRSKAIGEPPLMLAISGFLALKDAIAAVGEHRANVHLDAPATPERVLMACATLQGAGNVAKVGAAAK
jgi:xanthine dehydrogenase large subunit